MPSTHHLKIPNAANLPQARAAEGVLQLALAQMKNDIRAKLITQIMVKTVPIMVDYIPQRLLLFFAFGIGDLPEDFAQHGHVFKATAYGFLFHKP